MTRSKLPKKEGEGKKRSTGGLGMTEQSLKRFAQRAGLLRTNSLLFHSANRVMMNRLRSIVRMATTLAHAHKVRTLSDRHVVAALQYQGMRVYGVPSTLTDITMPNEKEEKKKTKTKAAAVAVAE